MFSYIFSFFAVTVMFFFFLKLCNIVIYDFFYQGFEMGLCSQIFIFVLYIYILRFLLYFKCSQMHQPDVLLLVQKSLSVSREYEGLFPPQDMLL